MFLQWLQSIVVGVQKRFAVVSDVNPERGTLRLGAISVTIHNLGNHTAALILSPSAAASNELAAQVWREAPRYSVDNLSVEHVVSRVQAHFQIVEVLSPQRVPS